MPIPADPADATDVASTVLVLFTQVHDQIRAEIHGLDEAGLNWIPGPETNSIATIVTHILGSEAESIRTVAGSPDERDRASEFDSRWKTQAQLARALEQADLLVTAATSDIDADRLRARLSLPTLAPDEQRSGLTWLVGNYGHAREHLGHIQLTKQLYRSIDQP
ncbi:MAG: DinB family protein [Acidimicrobiales bacterium]|jgi:hypothetical protein